MIIAAEPGYSLVLMRRPESGKDPWSADHIVRTPVLAWEYIGNGYLRPCMAFPLSDPDYVIETPSKAIIAYNQSTGGMILVDDLSVWLEMGSSAARAAEFARQTPQGNA